MKNEEDDDDGNTTLLELPLAMADECDGAEPPLAELLADARAIQPIAPSRLPAE